MRLAHSLYAFALAVALGATAGRAGPPAQPLPRRVVSTFLCTDEYIFRLLPRNRIAALSYLASDPHPVVSTIATQARGIPTVRASAEQVLALHPDLVVTYEHTNARQTQVLRAAGVPVLEVPWAQSLGDVRRITHLLGDRLGVPEKAKSLIAHMDAALRAAGNMASRPPVRTLIYEPNGYATAGGVTDEVLSAAGLRNLGTEMHATRSGTLPVEAVLTAGPDLLILNGEDEAAPARADLVLRHPALSALPKRTLVVRTSLVPLLCPGPWSADAAVPLATWGQQSRLLAGRRSDP